MITQFILFGNCSYLDQLALFKAIVDLRIPREKIQLLVIKTVLYRELPVLKIQRYHLNILHRKIIDKMHVLSSTSKYAIIRMTTGKLLLVDPPSGRICTTCN